MTFRYSSQKRGLAVALILLVLPVASYAQAVNTAEDQIKAKEGLLSGLTFKLKAAESKLSALQTEVADKTEKLSDLDLQVNQLQSQVADKNDSVKALKSALSDSEKQLVNVQAELSEKTDTLGALEEKVQKQEGRIAELKATLEQTSHGMAEKAVLNVEELQAELEAAVYTTREREAEIIKLRSDMRKAESLGRRNSQMIERLEFQRLVLGGLLILTVFGLGLALRPK